MKIKTKVKKWGNSGGVAVPKEHIGKEAEIKIKEVKNETRKNKAKRD